VVRWRITNEGDDPIRLLSAQQPHSQFRTPDMRLDREILAGAATDVTLAVRFNDAPGVIVENAFLILRFSDSAEWRLLARVRVTAGSSGEPIAGQSVVVTVQQVGTPD
jgi:hypothetical protein